MEEPPVQPSFYRLDDPFRAFALSRPHRAARKREKPARPSPRLPATLWRSVRSLCEGRLLAPKSGSREVK
jgi:hypothetical protein